MKNIGFILLIVLFSACGKERESTKPSHEELVEAVYSSVVIEPVNAYKVNSSITGYIDEVYFNEGDFVKKGDLLFLISNKPIALNEQNAELNYELLKDSYDGTANLIEEMKLDQKSSKMKMMYQLYVRHYHSQIQIMLEKSFENMISIMKNSCILIKELQIFKRG